MVPTLGKWRQEHQRSKVIFGYIAISNPADATMDPVSKRRQETEPLGLVMRLGFVTCAHYRLTVCSYTQAGCFSVGSDVNRVPF